jgi:hypothetical protein
VRTKETEKMILEKIYNHAPVWVQNVMCSVKGWTVDRKRFSKGFLEERFFVACRCREYDTENMV